MSIRRTILAGIAGAVAIDLYLCVTLPLLHMGTPLGLSQWDASNLLGAAAFRGGLSTAAIGFSMHMCVSIAWAIAFALAAARLRWLREHPLQAGLLFGVLVMGVMSYVVVPLGQATHPSTALAALANTLIAHTLFFGVPVAWVATGNKIS